MSETEFWTGIEVEGRFYGLPTLFVRANLNVRGDYKKVLDLCLKHIITHVWLCKETNLKILLAKYLSTYNIAVSIEITPDEITPQLLELTQDPGIRLVVQLDINPEYYEKILALKPTNEIRLTFGDKRTLGFALQHSWITNTEDYENDTNIYD